MLAGGGGSCDGGKLHARPHLLDTHPAVLLSLPASRATGTCSAAAQV